MPITKVFRSGVTPSVQKVPTSTTLTVLPLTPKQVGQELASEDEEPVQVESVNDAFEKFKPSVRFSAEVQGTEFKADLDFRSIKDFGIDNLQKRQSPGQRNDIADLKSKTDVLYQVKTLWSRPAVQRAWNNESRRKEIISALNLLGQQVARLKEGQS